MLLLLQTGLKVIIVVLALGISLVLVLPRIRGVDRPISPRASVLLSLGIFSLMCSVGLAEYVIEGRFRFYEAVMLTGTAGIVAVRVTKYIKARRKAV